jgi:serine/threonine protein phosphatase PrpC
MTNKHYLDDPTQALTDSFVSVEAAIESVVDAASCPKVITESGTTATVAVVRQGVLHIAHVGDSRAMYYRMVCTCSSKSAPALGIDCSMISTANSCVYANINDNLEACIKGNDTSHPNVNSCINGYPNRNPNCYCCINGNGYVKCNCKCPCESPSRHCELGNSLVKVTVDHSPRREDEKARIEAAGGIVEQAEHHLPWRVYKDRVSHKPGLAMTRALGDIDAQECGVLCEPETMTIPVCTDARALLGSLIAEYLVVASDGLWEALSNDEVTTLIHKSCCKGENEAELAEGLVQAALSHWFLQGKPATDDITVLVHRLR